MKPKFNFYEVVQVLPGPTVPKHLAGREGAVLGQAEDAGNGWTYAVKIEGVETNTIFYEQSLRSTGRSMKREDFYSGESIRVGVDPKTGHGKLLE